MRHIKEKAKYLKENDNLKSTGTILQEVLYMQRQLLDINKEQTNEAKLVVKTIENATEHMKNVETEAIKGMKEMVKAIKHGVNLKEKQIDDKIARAKMDIELHVQTFSDKIKEFFDNSVKEIETKFQERLSQSIEKTDAISVGVENNVRILMINVQSSVFALLNDVQSNVSNIWSRVLGQTNVGLHLNDLKLQLNRKQAEFQKTMRKFLEVVGSLGQNSRDFEEADVENDPFLMDEEHQRQSANHNMYDMFDKEPLRVNSDKTNSLTEHQHGLSNVKQEMTEEERKIEEEKKIAAVEWWREIGWDRAKDQMDETIKNAVLCERGEDCVRPIFVGEEFDFAYRSETYKDKDYGKARKWEIQITCLVKQRGLVILSYICIFTISFIIFCGRLVVRCEIKHFPTVEIKLLKFN